MTYVIVEFFCGNAPQLVEEDLALSHCALCVCRPMSRLVERQGPTFNSRSVWDTETEQMVAVYRPMKSLLPLL